MPTASSIPRLITNNEFHAIQATAAGPLEEAGLVLLHALGGAQNLAVSVLSHRNRHQNCYIFKFPTLVAAQIDPIHVDIRSNARLAEDGSANPQCGHTLSCSAHLDGRGRDFAAPQDLRDVLHAPDGYACQVHFNERFFRAALPAAVSLNDSCLKGDPFELGYFQGDIPPKWW